MSGLFMPAIKEDVEAQGRVRRWIEALRSGAYRQTKNRLHRNKGFCCLGVACDLIDPSRWSAPPVVLERGVFGYDGAETTLLPMEIRDAYQIAGMEGSLDDYVVLGKTKGGNTLADLNDRGATFKQIAGLIESELEEALA